MIESIEILIIKEGYDIYKALIVPTKNICYINNQKNEINNQKIDRILDIISTWNYEYGNSNVLDAEEFTISVYSNKKDTYHGKGIFPKSYNQLIKILGDVKNGK